MIRVFVVDDSPFIRKALGRILSSRPDMLLAGSAGSGREALDRIPAAKPHVVTLDVEMPGMNGLDTLRELMARYPGLPVIMLSAYTQSGANTTLDAMSLGAVDFIDKSGFNVMDFDRLSRELIGKIEIWRANRRYVWDGPRRGEPDAAPPAITRTRTTTLGHIDWSLYDLCVIGASTGGPPAIQSIVEHTPPNFPVPIVLVQHMPLGFTRAFADRLNHLGRIKVRETRDRDEATPGTMLIARAGAHLYIEPDLQVAVTLDPINAKHIPSVDVLMMSAATARAERVVSILLTGMGDDGAAGMQAIHEQGGLTIAEHESTCVVYGMPRAAHERGAVQHLLPLPEICRLFSDGGTSR